MSLPVAHSLAGVTVSLSLRKRGDLRFTPSELAVALLVPLLPDVDFLLEWGFGCDAIVCRRTYTHSLPSALLLAVVFTWLGLGRGVRRPSANVRYLFLLIASHGVLDFLHGPNPWSPSGVALLWPFTSTRWSLPWTLLPNVPIPARSPWVLVRHWRAFLATSLLEGLCFLPVLAGVWVVKHGWSGAGLAPAASSRGGASVP